MNLQQLVRTIREVHDLLARQATKAVNIRLTIRNWLIGCHIQEYELRGEDRSEYGERLFEVLAAHLTRHGLSSCNRRQLYRYRDFYRLYPRIVGTLSPQFQEMLPACHADEKVGTASPQSAVPSFPLAKLLETLSYSHFELLTAIDDPLRAEERHLHA